MKTIYCAFILVASSLVYTNAIGCNTVNVTVINKTNETYTIALENPKHGKWLSSTPITVPASNKTVKFTGTNKPGIEGFNANISVLKIGKVICTTNFDFPYKPLTNTYLIVNDNLNCQSNNISNEITKKGASCAVPFKKYYPADVILSIGPSQ